MVRSGGRHFRGSWAIPVSYGTNGPRSMSLAPASRSAVVADGRPLGRNLVRFLLEEHGYDIVAEAATAFDTVRAASEHRPDLIVVHENCVAPESRFGIARVRDASPASRIVVVVGRRAAVHAAYGGAADAIVEEGPGLQALGLALEGDDEREEPRSRAGRSLSWWSRSRSRAIRAARPMARTTPGGGGRGHLRGRARAGPRDRADRARRVT